MILSTHLLAVIPPMREALVQHFSLSHILTTVLSHSNELCPKQTQARAAGLQVIVGGEAVPRRYSQGCDAPSEISAGCDSDGNSELLVL
jgi:hypothetical protein